MWGDYESEIANTITQLDPQLLLSEAKIDSQYYTLMIDVGGTKIDLRDDIRLLTLALSTGIRLALKKYDFDEYTKRKEASAQARSQNELQVSLNSLHF